MRDIKASAATGNQAAVKQLALSLVRLRAQMGKLSASEAHLRGVRTNLSVSSAGCNHLDCSAHGGVQNTMANSASRHASWSRPARACQLDRGSANDVFIESFQLTQHIPWGVL